MHWVYLKLASTPSPQSKALLALAFSPLLTSLPKLQPRPWAHRVHPQDLSQFPVLQQERTCR